MLFVLCLLQGRMRAAPEKQPRAAQGARQHPGPLCPAGQRLGHPRRHRAKRERGQQQISPSAAWKPPYCRKRLDSRRAIWSRWETWPCHPRQLPQGESCGPRKAELASALPARACSRTTTTAPSRISACQDHHCSFQDTIPPGHHLPSSTPSFQAHHPTRTPPSSQTTVVAGLQAGQARIYLPPRTSKYVTLPQASKRDSLTFTSYGFTFPKWFIYAEHIPWCHIRPSDSGGARTAPAQGQNRGAVKVPRIVSNLSLRPAPR